MNLITKENLEHLAELARIKLEEKQGDKLLADLQNILAYFDELKEGDVSGVEPMSGGTFSTNSWREKDEPAMKDKNEREKIVGAFPEKEGEFLKIPPVFE